MMNYIYRLIILLLVFGFTACTYNQPDLSAANDEDNDVGIGGTGMLAASESDSDSGIGGTGVLGEITGFGSIFVNGIEIEYDRETTFTINGEPAGYQQLEVGDVVEVLTTDQDKHTDAKIINLRHEVIGTVEAIDPQTFSFTVQGQTIVQPINKMSSPELGSRVAVSGFRVDKNTIVSTRVLATDAKTTLLRTQTKLPFKDQTTNWLVQMHVKENKAVFQLGDTAHVLNIKDRTEKTYADPLGIRILQLHKPASGEVRLEGMVETMSIPRGKPVEDSIPGRSGNMLQNPGTGSIPGPGMGHGSGTGSGANSGSGRGQQNGSHMR